MRENKNKKTGEEDEELTVSFFVFCCEKAACIYHIKSMFVQ